MYVKALDSAMRSAFKEFVADRAIVEAVAARAVEVPLAHRPPDVVQRRVRASRANAATTLPYLCRTSGSKGTCCTSVSKRSAVV